MSSKNKGRKRKLLLHLSSYFVGLILIFFVTLYVFVPSYRFENPHPFTGKYIHNPYQNLTEVRWDYYDFRDNSSHVSSYEFGYGLSQAKYLCLDYKSKRKIDYPFFQNVHFKQHNIERLEKDCSIVALTNIDKGFKPREIKHLDKYRLMEVLSPYGNFFKYWDTALSSGHRVNIMASSNRSKENNFEHKTVICSDYISKEELMKSLKDGDSYAISYRKDCDDLPELKKLTIINDSIFVHLSRVAKEIRFIGQDAIVKDSLQKVDKGAYLFKENDTYIRIEIDFDDETTIYLNPIVRHQFQYFFDASGSEILKERTWLLRTICIFAIIFFIRYLLSIKRLKNNENTRE